MPTGEGAGAGSGAGAPGSKPSPAAELAQVESVLLAHEVRPEEPLAVRLLGAVGPDGSWALDSVQVRREPGRIVLEPRVRRVEGDFFIQMVIPLDHTVSMDLPAGEHRIEIRSRDSVAVETVRVSAESKRAAPAVNLEPDAKTPAQPDGAGAVTRRFTAQVQDGWIDRVEYREIAAGKASPWRAADAVQRIGAALQGTITVRLASGDPERRVELRAIDGQGSVSPTVEFVLPARVR